MPTPEARQLRAQALRRRLKAFGAVTAIWFTGAIMGGAGVWFISGYLADRQSAELRHDHNALVCVLRSLVIPQRARAVQAQDDQSQSASARKRAHASIVTYDKVLAGLLTIPPGYDCSKFSVKLTT